MDAILKLSPADLRLACIEVEGRMRLQAASVEKDFWVFMNISSIQTRNFSTAPTTTQAVLLSHLMKPGMR